MQAIPANLIALLPEFVEVGGLTQVIDEGTLAHIFALRRIVTGVRNPIVVTAAVLLLFEAAVFYWVENLRAVGGVNHTRTGALGRGEVQIVEVQDHVKGKRFCKSVIEADQQRVVTRAVYLEHAEFGRKEEEFEDLVDHTEGETHRERHEDSSDSDERVFVVLRVQFFENLEKFHCNPEKKDVC